MENNKVLTELKSTVLDFDAEKAESLAIECVNSDADIFACISSLTEGIHIIGDKFGKGEIYLPELIIASNVLEAAMPILNTALEKQGHQSQSLGKIVIGTVEGDVHSLGKNIVATLFKAEGFEVIDLGVDVSADKFIEVVDKENADLLALSALLTTTMIQQERIINELKRANERKKVKVIVGGSPVTQEYANKIGADGYESTAGNAAKLARELIDEN